MCNNLFLLFGMGRRNNDSAVSFPDKSLHNAGGISSVSYGYLGILVQYFWHLLAIMDLAEVKDKADNLPLRLMLM